MNIWQIVDMGGYGAYVWPSYALAAVMLIYHVIKPWRTEKRLRSRYKELNDRDDDL